MAVAKKTLDRIISKAAYDIQRYGYVQAATYSALIGLGLTRSQIVYIEKQQ